MSKNLEREYRALVNSEVPDLWARIEAGLEEKKAAPEKKVTDLHITDFPVTDSQMEEIRDKKVNFGVWAGLAAACVCVVLVIPAMTRSLTMSGGSGSSNSAPNYAAQDSTPQAAEEPYGKTEGVIQEGAAAYEDMDYAVAGAAENGMNNSVTTSDHTNMAADSNVGTVNVSSGGLEEAAEEEQEPFVFHATVEILDMEERMDSGILYTARVIWSENPNLQADSEIRIFSSAEGVMTLENSQTYDLMLCEEHSDDSGQGKTYLLVNDAVE